MSYNISEVTGNFYDADGDGYDTWVADLTLADASVTGDFSLDDNGDRIGEGEAPGGYVFYGLNTSAYGTLTVNNTSGKFTFVIDKQAVINSGTDQTISFSVRGKGGARPDVDQVIINIAICVQRGTMIQTKNGDVAVEDLEPGMRVRTLDSGYQPVRWIGSRSLGAADLDLAPELRPIRLAAGSLGPGSPSQDLLVSPQHRVLVTGWKAELYFGQREILVPAKSLVNDSDIRIAHDVEDVEYFHVMFDRHEIMLTNGAPTESFFPGDYVLDELNPAIVTELRAIFPDILSDGGSFGAAARRSVRPGDAVVLKQDALL
ncbi:Hint domain-containing protein [Roseovarius dicentrarchi]|uniref:Hint domain-containing protein n=1 Tax=Roseovarius dicentrarchi TaxID=2250573 RepID=UPI000DE89223|nr:Hint domain-containing protein [Roseovarius dicentrarchi]